MKQQIKWLEKPEEHDYPAAASYLSLIYANGFTVAAINKLKLSKIAYFKSKDIFRASGLPLLSPTNSHVKKNLKKIKNGEKLSPIILVRDSSNGRVIIADGYHRMCSVYNLDEDVLIPCVIA